MTEFEMIEEVPNKAAGIVALAPGLELWREVEVRVRDYKGYDVVVRVVADGERLRAAEVRVIQREGGAEVTAESLRHIKVKAFVQRAVLASSRLEGHTGLSGDAPSEDGEHLVFGLLDVKHRDLMREAGPITETLQWVARIYRLALALGDRPTKQVEEVFGIPGSTASRWVSAARNRGFLAAAEPGKAGG